MIETALSVNGQDCTGAPDNTPEEYEVMAATLLRVAQAVRDQENGAIKCLSRNGRVLVSAIVHNPALVHNGAEPEFPTIERLHCIDKSPDRAIEFRNISRSLIDHFRRLNVESR